MNIFVLDTDIQKCVRYHVDKHVVKMILEYTQLLCTAHHIHGFTAPYRPTHSKHPCTLWAAHSLSNWLWLKRLALALHDEYQYRYGSERSHKSLAVIESLQPPPIPDHGLTEFAQAMPEFCKVSGDAVQAYRRFYVAEKAGFAQWTRRRKPAWFTDALFLHDNQAN